MDIITEVPGHAPLVELAARYRLPVICQKPFAPDLATCEHMLNVCREVGVPLSINENFRWQPPLRSVHEALTTAGIGKIHHAHIHLASGGPASFITQPFLKTLKHCALTDMGSHAFDLARFYFGEAQSVYCQTFKSLEDLSGEDIFSALSLHGEIICHCQVSEFVASRVVIEGTEGLLELTSDNQINITNRQGTRTISPGWPRHAWVSPQDEALHGSDCIHSIYAGNFHLLEALRQGIEPETSATDNLRTARLMFAAITSVEEKRTVFL
jgi:predicted dehydrogenase